MFQLCGSLCKTVSISTGSVFLPPHHLPPTHLTLTPTSVLYLLVYKEGLCCQMLTAASWSVLLLSFNSRALIDSSLSFHSVQLGRSWTPFK